MALGAHAGVGEDLRDRVLGRGRLLALISAGERLQIIARVIVGDELQGVSDTLDEVGFFDRGHEIGLLRAFKRRDGRWLYRVLIW